LHIGKLKKQLKGTKAVEGAVKRSQNRLEM